MGAPRRQSLDTLQFSFLSLSDERVRANTRTSFRSPFLAIYRPSRFLPIVRLSRPAHVWASYVVVCSEPVAVSIIGGHREVLLGRPCMTSWL